MWNQLSGRAGHVREAHHLGRAGPVDVGRAAGPRTRGEVRAGHVRVRPYHRGSGVVDLGVERADGVQGRRPLARREARLQRAVGQGLRKHPVDQHAVVGGVRGDVGRRERGTVEPAGGGLIRADTSAAMDDAVQPQPDESGQPSAALLGRPDDRETVDELVIRHADVGGAAQTVAIAVVPTPDRGNDACLVPGQIAARGGAHRGEVGEDRGAAADYVPSCRQIGMTADVDIYPGRIAAAVDIAREAAAEGEHHAIGGHCGHRDGLRARGSDLHRRRWICAAANQPMRPCR